MRSAHEGLELSRRNLTGLHHRCPRRELVKGTALSMGNTECENEQKEGGNESSHDVGAIFTETNLPVDVVDTQHGLHWASGRRGRQPKGAPRSRLARDGQR